MIVKWNLCLIAGMLIKRPILVTEKGLCVGFKEEEWKEII